jgi:hypothetical protein
VRERGERWRDAAGLHLPHVLPLEVDAAALVGTELGHREPAPAPERAQRFPVRFSSSGSPGTSGLTRAGIRSLAPTNSMIASITSAP